MLIGFRCPPNGEKPGRCNTFDYCLTSCSKRCMPKPVLVLCRDHNVQNEHKGEMISPSALKGCVRKLALERTTSFYTEPPKLWYSVRGTLIHSILEGHNLPLVHVEQRLYKSIRINGKDLVVSGRLDYYDEAERTIEDWKSANEKVKWFLFNEGCKPEHRLQTSVYKWLAWGGHVGSIDGPQVFWPVDKIIVHTVLMNEIISTGRTHYERVTGFQNPNNGKRYKLEKSRKKVAKSPRGVPVWELAIDIPAVKMMTVEEVESYMTGSVGDVKDGFDAVKAGDMPAGVLYDSDQAWACGYCSVVEKCHDYERRANPDTFKRYIQLQQVE